MKCSSIFLLTFFSYNSCYSATLLDSEWDAWKTQHGVVYKDSEYEGRRRQVWEDNYNTIEEHNRGGNNTFKLGLNTFADLVR